MLNVGGAIWWGYALVVVMHQLPDYVKPFIFRKQNRLHRVKARLTFTL